MAGSKKAGAVMRQTMIAKYGSEEAWKAHMRAIAAVGGRVKKKEQQLSTDSEHGDQLQDKL